MYNPNKFDKIYSEAIYAFITRTSALAAKIVQYEMKLEMGRKRFYFNNYSYPLDIIVFEHPSKLGYFDQEFFEIGIHKKMLFCKDQNILTNLLRHELAHYYCFISCQETIADHGSYYRQICKKFGWDKEVYSASVALSDTDFSSSITSHKVLNKIQKLLSLATSPHANESEAATLKANELLIKHNLKADNLPGDKQMLSKRLFCEKRASVKLSAISSILRCFFVFPVLSRTSEGSYLEIFGDSTNIKIAEYVGVFLDKKLDEMWEETKKSHPSMKGTTKKNSFFRGLAKGYTEKMKSFQSQAAHKNALLVVEKVLQEHVEKAYPRLSSKSSSYQNCKTASMLGEKEGKNLNIKQGIAKNSNGSSSLFLN
jgi:hypothetical protein